MQEILDFINSNLENIMKKGSGRLDYTTEKGIKVKMFNIRISFSKKINFFFIKILSNNKLSFKNIFSKTYINIHVKVKEHIFFLFIFYK